MQFPTANQPPPIRQRVTCRIHQECHQDDKIKSVFCVSHNAIQNIHDFNDAIFDQRRNIYAKFLPTKKCNIRHNGTGYARKRKTKT